MGSNAPAEQFPFLESGRILPFAHRGGTSVAPENTLAAFENAVELGYRYLETDVHRTADGELVAFHDPGLSRLGRDSRMISEITWDELSEVRIDGHPIPRMADLFERFGDAKFNIDPKSDDAVKPLVDVINAAGAIDRVCVGSFSDARIALAKRLLGPRLCTSPGPRSVISAIVPWPLAPEHPCVSVPQNYGHYRLGARMVRRFQAQGYRVHVWTVNDEAEMNRLIDLGVDGIMTDECELLKSVLVARGQWS